MLLLRPLLWLSQSKIPPALPSPTVETIEIFQAEIEVTDDVVDVPRLWKLKRPADEEIER